MYNERGTITREEQLLSSLIKWVGLNTFGMRVDCNADRPGVIKFCRPRENGDPPSPFSSVFWGSPCENEDLLQRALAKVGNLRLGQGHCTVLGWAGFLGQVLSTGLLFLGRGQDSTAVN